MTRRARDERGFLTIWLLGLCLILLVLGGVSLDLWRAFSDRQALAGVADAGALAGAAGLDVDAARRGAALLDPADAQRRAEAAIAGQVDSGGLVGWRFVIAPDRTSITVTADGLVHLTLLRLLLGDRPLALHASSTATARGS